MPFLAPFIPAIVKGGAAVGASLLGNKLSKTKPSAAEQGIFGNLEQAGKTGLQSGKTLLDMGTAGMQQPMNYWANILSGNRSAMLSALGPEASQIGQGYQTAARTSAALNPRSGPSAEFNAELPFQQQRDVTQLLQRARPDAAKNLADTSSGALGNAVNALYLSTNAGRARLQSEEVRRAEEARRGEAIGGGIFDLLTRFPNSSGQGILDRLESLLGGGGKIGTKSVIGNLSAGGSKLGI